MTKRDIRRRRQKVAGRKMPVQHAAPQGMQQYGPFRKTYPWQMFFWISWPMALLLGTVGGYHIARSRAEQTERQLRAELSEAKQAIEEFSLDISALEQEVEKLELAAERSARRPVSRAAVEEKPEPEKEQEPEPARPAAGTDEKTAPPAVAVGSDDSVPDLFSIIEADPQDVPEGDLQIMRPTTARNLRTYGPWRGDKTRNLQQTFYTAHPWTIEYAMRPKDAAAGCSMVIKLMENDGAVTDEYRVTRSRGTININHTGRFSLNVVSENCQWNVKVEVPF